MKSLGVKQFQQMRFELLPLPDKFKGILGNVPKSFMCIIYGDSGNGKTEFCIQLAKELASFGKVAWLSYEQGHGYDLQIAVNRNKMDEVSGNFIPIDPTNKPGNISFLQDLDEYLRKRNSPEFIFIDSLDYTEFNWEDYVFLKTKYGKKKTFIWISHAEGIKPKKAIATKIQYDGGIGIYIKNYIARIKKNRFGGFEDYIIYEERARLLEPLYFKSKEVALEKVKEKHKTASNQIGMFNNETTANGTGSMHLVRGEAMGVNAEL